MKMNKKGFTLVELLAVIVILAIVMLVGVTAVGPILEKSRKNGILDEGAAITDAALLAYSSQDAFGGTVITSGSTLSIDTLVTAGYYIKKNAKMSGCFKLTDNSGVVTVTYSLFDEGTKYGIKNGGASSTIDKVNKSDFTAAITTCNETVIS